MTIIQTMLTMTDTTSCTAAAKPEMTAEDQANCSRGRLRSRKSARSGVRCPNKTFPVEKRNDDLVTQVASKYGPERAQAQCDVDALLKGCRNLTLTANGRAEATSSDGLGRFYRPATAMEGDKNGCTDFR